jgi:hypothetical protein
LKHKLWLSLSIALGLVVIVLAVLILPYSVKVNTVTGSLSLSINKVQADELSDWNIKFNPSGTSVESDGYLYIRLDFYPSSTSKSYNQYYVNVPDETSKEFLAGYPGLRDARGRPLDQKAWREWYDNLPHIWQLNPALCHFVKISPSITKAELTTFINSNFGSSTIGSLDDILIKSDSADYLSWYFTNNPDKISVTNEKSQIIDKQLTISQVNSNLEGFIIGGIAPSYTSGELLHNSIDIGVDPTSAGGSSGGATYFTLINVKNPANASGNLDTFQVRAISAIGTLYAATFHGSGTTWVGRGSITLGAVATGTVVSFTGKTYAVTSGDLLGCYYESGDVDWRTTGSPSGVYDVSGNYLGSSSSGYSLDGAGEYEMSLYATGTESGGTPSLTNSPTSLNLGTIFPDGRTVYFKGNAPGNPVESGNCTFTITNDGSITENITASMTNLTGGTTWTLTSSAPGANTFRMTIYYQGQNPASGKVLTTAAQAFYNGLTSSSTIKWDGKLEMPTSSTDTTGKTGTLQLTAISP